MEANIHHRSVRTLVVRPEFSDNCVFDVYIDGQKHNGYWGELYRFNVDSIEHGAKKIMIDVHSGTIKILSRHSIAYYPLFVFGKWSKIPIYQENYINWMNGDSNFPVVISSGERLEYLHLFPNGPNYVEYHIDYDMIPVSTDVLKNTNSVIENYRMKNE